MKQFSVILLVSLATRAWASGSPEQPIVLTAESGSMVVHADVPMLGGQRFSAVLPKALGDADHLFINEPQSCSVRWSGPGAHGEWVATSAHGTSVEFRITLLPLRDRVDLEYAVTNRGGSTLSDVWMLTYFAPRDPSWLGDGILDRITMEDAEGTTTLALTDRPPGPRPELGIYPRAGAPPLPHFIRSLRSASATAAHGDWMELSRPDGARVRVQADQTAFLFSNAQTASLHAAPSFGDIAPGETAVVKGRWEFTASPAEETTP